VNSSDKLAAIQTALAVALIALVATAVAGYHVFEQKQETVRKCIGAAHDPATCGVHP
jgi:hypothetical protein